MKPTAKPQSKIPTTGKNTNQKKKVASQDPMDMDTSLLKKNEFTLIIAGALVVTVVVFFVFFWDSGKDTGPPVISGNGKAQVDTAMEKRLAELEVTVARLSASQGTADGGESNDAKGEFDQRLDRLETAMTLKMDALIGRLAKAEKRISELKQAASRPAPVVTKAPASKPAEKAPVTKKPVQQPKKASMFHTVKKGETLWSISQKYKTTVPAIRKLNNLSPEDKIYPGTNILVR